MLNLSDEPLPARVDYRGDEKIVTPVKNQGDCGCCWAFATTGLLESMEHKWNPTIKQVTSLSEQQLLDCLYPDGCDGGDQTYAIDYIKSVGGLMEQIDYEYRERQSDCKFNSALIYEPTKKLTGYLRLGYGNEDLLKRVVAEYGPVAIGFEVTDIIFDLVPGEIYQDPECNGTVNHAVLLVGYGTSETGEDYWIIKNSWGVLSGDLGNYYLARNLNNSCDVASDAIIIV